MIRLADVQAWMGPGEFIYHDKKYNEITPPAESELYCVKCPADCTRSSMWEGVAGRCKDESVIVEMAGRDGAVWFRFYQDPAVLPPKINPDSGGKEQGQSTQAPQSEGSGSGSAP